MRLNNSLVGSRLGVIKSEKLLDPSDLHRISHSLRYSDQRQAASILLMVDVRTHKGPDPGGIDVGYARQIQDQLARGIASY